MELLYGQKGTFSCGMNTRSTQEIQSGRRFRFILPACRFSHVITSSYYIISKIKAQSWLSRQSGSWTCNWLHAIYYDLCASSRCLFSYTLTLRCRELRDQPVHCKCRGSQVVKTAENCRTVSPKIGPFWLLTTGFRTITGQDLMFRCSLIGGSRAHIEVRL